MLTKDRLELVRAWLAGHFLTRTQERAIGFGGAPVPYEGVCVLQSTLMQFLAQANIPADVAIREARNRGWIALIVKERYYVQSDPVTARDIGESTFDRVVWVVIRRVVVPATVDVEHELENEAPQSPNAEVVRAPKLTRQRVKRENRLAVIQGGLDAGDDWKQITEDYKALYPHDKKASKRALQLMWDRHSDKSK